MEFTLLNDDGRSTDNLEEADVVLLGISLERQKASISIPQSTRHKGN